MKSARFSRTSTPLILKAEVASDLMSANPVSLRAEATLKEALQLLIDHGYCAAPVIDGAGRPVGVLSRSDLLVHDRESVEYCQESPEYFHGAELEKAAGEPVRSGFQVEKVDRTQVRDLMTPAIFAVAPDSSVAEVIANLVELKVHRLFVVDDGGVLVGVISTLDVLRHLGAND